MELNDIPFPDYMEDDSETKCWACTRRAEDIYTHRDPPLVMLIQLQWLSNMVGELSKVFFSKGHKDLMVEAQNYYRGLDDLVHKFLDREFGNEYYDENGAFRNIKKEK